MATDSVFEVWLSLRFECELPDGNGFLEVQSYHKTQLPFVPAVGMMLSISDDEDIPNLEIYEVRWDLDENCFHVTAEASIRRVNASTLQYLATKISLWRFADQSEVTVGE